MITENRNKSVIDFHTHILPGIDDGSQDVRETLGLLSEESQQNVDCIVATPHFYADRFSMEEFLRRRDASLQLLRETVAESPVAQSAAKLVRSIQYVGAEVYYFPGIGRAEKLRDLCIRPISRAAKTGPAADAVSDLILIEMPFVQWTDAIYHELLDILQRQRMRIILAHVERYPQFQKDQRVWNQVMSLPLCIQINGGSFLKSRSRRKFCLDLIKNDENVILGSDCHNLSSRKPNLSEARRVIAKKLGSAALDRLDQAAEQLLR